MLVQYTATIKKVSLRGREREGEGGYFWHLCSASLPQANVNGRVLTQCNIDELKNEMKMNFGDWQLFRGTVSTLALTLLLPVSFYCVVYLPSALTVDTAVTVWFLTQYGVYPLCPNCALVMKFHLLML
jgi:hypothetical protein